MIFRSTLRVGQDIAPGIKGKYNRVCTSRVYLSSDISYENAVRPPRRGIAPPRNLARHCNPQRLRLFPPDACVRPSLQKTCRVFFTSDNVNLLNEDSTT